MGGLFAGALLARAGHRVTVLEKNTIIGGGLQSFRRNGVWFNTGMHNFGGFGEQWALSHMFRYLGIKERLHVMETDPNAQEIVWTGTGHCYRLPRGREQFEQYLAGLFPQQKDGIHRYLDALYVIADTFDLYNLRRPTALLPVTTEYTNLSVEQLIRLFIDDEELIRVLSYMTPLCGLPINQVAATVHSMLTVLYLDGEYRFEDNALQLAAALANVIEHNGGKVVNNAKVSTIRVHEAHVQAVETTDGRVWQADKYIAAIAPRLVFKMLTETIVRKVSLKRAEEFSTDSSALCIYLQLKEGAFPFINSTVFIPTATQDSTLPPYILITTPPVRNQGEWAHTMEILVPCHYAEFAKWTDSTVGARGDEYEAYKRARAEQIIAYVSGYYAVQDAIEYMEVASPLTIRDFYNSPEGALFSQQGLFMPMMTRTDNLYFTGQSVLFHGLCGVPLTAILTAEAVSGKDLLTGIIQAGQS